MNLEQLDFASKKKLVRDACHLYLRIKNLNISNKIASKYNMSVKRQLEIDNNLKIKSFFWTSIRPIVSNKPSYNRKLIS